MSEENNIKNQNDKKQSDTKALVSWIRSIVIAVLIAFSIRYLLFSTTFVVGSSMYPTLHERDRIVSFRLPVLFGKVNYKDIVLIEAPDEPKKDYIKRVIALEGDKVEIIDGKVYLNDKVLVEEYVKDDSFTTIYTVSSWDIPKGYIFVMGDNREHGASKDSRFFGPVSKNKVKGIAKYIYYPFDSRFGNISK